MAGSLVVFASLLCFFLVMLWPENPKSLLATPTPTTQDGGISTQAAANSVSGDASSTKTSNAATTKDDGQNSKTSYKLNKEQRILLLVMLAGALGSFIHIAISFSEFVGNSRFSATWIYWYMLKPLTSTALAAIFYLVLRGGLMSGDGGDAVNLHGVVAMSGMVGLFSKQATSKLAEVFDTLFHAKPRNTDTGKAAEKTPPEVPLADGSEAHPTATQATPTPPPTQVAKQEENSPPLTTQARTTLRRGASGGEVQQLQKALNLAVDGNFGPKTEAAVREFQRTHDIVPDGIVGAKTWAALDASQPPATT